MKFRLLILSAHVLSAHVLGAQDTAAVSGCYRFDRSYFHWVGRRPAGDLVVDSTDVLRLAPDATIDRPFARGPVLDVYPVPFLADARTTRRWLGPSHWAFADASTLNVVWRNGLYGPVFRLEVSGDSLKGQVRFTTDIVGAERPQEPAWAVRIPCPTPDSHRLTNPFGGGDVPRIPGS